MKASSGIQWLGQRLRSHLSTHATQSSEPAGDNAPGIALMRQLGTLGQSFQKMASTHQTVALSAQAGSSKANARGFRNFTDYRARILFHCGKLNLAMA